jgi:hypothetical protein
MEKLTEYRNLRKVVHRVYCDQCDIELYSTGMAYATYPPHYPYRCSQCGKEYVFGERYPWSEIVGDEV